MRDGAAQAGDEPGKPVFLQPDGVGGRQVGGDDYLAFIGFPQPIDEFVAVVHQGADDTFHNLGDIDGLAAQVRILHPGKHHLELAPEPGQRRLRIDVLLPDKSRRFVQQHGIFQHGDMGFQQSRHLRGQGPVIAGLEVHQRIPGLANAGRQALQFRLHRVRPDGVPADFRRRPADDPRPADGNAVPDAGTVQGQHQVRPRNSRFIPPLRNSPRTASGSRPPRPARLRRPPAAAGPSPGSRPASGCP